MTTNDLTGSKRVLIAIALLFGFFASLLTQPAKAQTVDEAIQAVEKHYQDIGDLTAKVVQKNNLKSIGKTQTFNAELWIKKPGKLKLDYTNGQIILVDGKAALFYSKKSGQVIKKTFTDFEHMNIPVAFLLGAAHIRDDFDVLQPDPKTPRRLELIPKKPGAVMTKLVLESNENGRISELTIHDRSGNTTAIGFHDVREDVKLEDKLFTFKPPKGTEVIEQ